MTSTSCIESNAPDFPGVCWIETTMPVEIMRKAISSVLDKEKKIRKTYQKGIGLIAQNEDDWHVAYSGTEENIRKRLKQHLFN